MKEPVNAFDVTPEQQHTANLLQRLLGKAIADRYVDFCRLAGGGFGLRVSRPMAAHALRELDSMLRKILEVPMETKAPENAVAPEALKSAQQALRALGVDNAAVQRATNALNPPSSHKEQIQKIVTRLGLAPDGDVANCWSPSNPNTHVESPRVKGRRHSSDFTVSWITIELVLAEIGIGKMALRDHRPKRAPQGPKCRKLPTKSRKPRPVKKRLLF
jgi:hypothetical protein